MEEKCAGNEYQILGLISGTILLIIETIGITGTIFDDKTGISSLFCMGAILAMIVPSAIHLLMHH